ncbi:hypothetical protein BH09VER1_BH09VER1_42850 [soil metagenome]
MKTLAAKRCFNHAAREPVAHCTNCRNFFCRECISEHDDRMLCAACLITLATAAPPRRARLVPVIRGGQLVLSLMAAWIFFYLVGVGLLSIPSSFHQNTFWKPPAEEEE